MEDSQILCRREFMKTALLGLGGWALRPFDRLLALSDFPQGEFLGRVGCAGVELKARPAETAQTLRRLSEVPISLPNL